MFQMSRNTAAVLGTTLMIHEFKNKKQIKEHVNQTMLKWTNLYGRYAAAMLFDIQNIT